MRIDTTTEGRLLLAIARAVGAALLLQGCVMRSTYDSMLQQQQALEAALGTEIDADQVEIEQLRDGIRVEMASALLYREGAVELAPSGTRALDKVAPELASQTYQIDVVGNTDDLPIEEPFRERYPSNWELAGERAAIVVRHLQSRGVDPGRMRAISAGQYHPVAPNDSPADRARNRRTEILLRPR